MKIVFNTPVFREFMLDLDHTTTRQVRIDPWRIAWGTLRNRITVGETRKIRHAILREFADTR